jgi:diguanylate cyclase (GGDEF)-like protein
VLFAGAAFLAMQGFRRFFGLPATGPIESTAYGALVAGLVYWGFASPDANMRITVVSIFLTYVRFNIGWTAYRMRPPHRPAYSYYFVALVAMLGGFVHATRGLAAAFGWEHHTRFLQATPMNVVFVGVGIITLPCISIGAIMLAYDRMAERMERLATIDELTGALVRRAFMAQAELQLARADRAGTPVAVAILDIDNFKALNDAHGHAAGDRALSLLASVVSREIRRGDIFGRLGGEEFAVLLPATSREDAIALINRLRVRVAEATMSAPCGTVACTFSAGVDEYQPGEELATLVARADAALYSAKAMGRNRVVSAIRTDDHGAPVALDSARRNARLD